MIGNRLRACALSNRQTLEAKPEYSRLRGGKVDTRLLLRLAVHVLTVAVLLS